MPAHPFLWVLASAFIAACAELPPPDAAPVTTGGGPRAGPRPTQELHDSIVARDRELFAAVFDTCDTKALAALVTEDLEFFHDKGGLTSTSGEQFVKDIERNCERQRTGENYRARRELVPGTMKVYPINNYGAIAVGEHRFYRLWPDRPEQLVEVALFTMVWRKDESGWKLARVLSYDHRLTER